MAEDFRLIYKRKRITGRSVCQAFLVYILLFICHASGASPQTPDTTRLIRHTNVQASDTTITEKDRREYERIKEAAQKKEWTDALYSAFFSESKTPDTQETSSSLDQQYIPYDGRVINNIKIIVLEPFGTDINHPDSVNADNWFNKTANSLHINTKRYIIRGNLLFKAGDAVDPLVIAESEAFLRNTGYINDARIQIDSIPGTQMADVTVTVRDVFSIGLELHDLSVNSIDLEVYDKNFLGTGNRFWLRGIHDGSYSPTFGYGAGYLYSNLMNTFINLKASYLDQIWINEASLSAERPLQTSLDYYGKLDYYRMKQRIDQMPWDSINPPFLETWLASFGRAFNPFGHGSPKRISVAVGYIDNSPSYAAIEPGKPDPMQYEFVPSQSLLAQYSFFSQRYYRQYMIHNFGITENLASGYNITGQVGYTRCPGYFEGMYTSLEFSAGKMYDIGNLYARAAIGTHFDHRDFYQGIIRFNGNYFTPLMRVGKSRLRQFVNVNYANVLNPIDGITDYVFFSTLTTLRTYYFDQQAKGSERFMVNLETDFFTTLNVLGFRFLLFSFFDGGWLRMNGELFNADNFYCGFGVGLRIRNDLLVFRTLVLKIGYYPRFDQNLGNMLQFTTSEPARAPDFLPAYPQEITLK